MNLNSNRRRVLPNSLTEYLTHGEWEHIESSLNSASVKGLTMMQFLVVTLTPALSGAVIAGLVFGTIALTGYTTPWIIGSSVSGGVVWIACVVFLFLRMNRRMRAGMSAFAETKAELNRGLSEKGLQIAIGSSSVGGFARGVVVRVAHRVYRGSDPVRTVNLHLSNESKPSGYLEEMNILLEEAVPREAYASIVQTLNKSFVPLISSARGPLLILLSSLMPVFLFGLAAGLMKDVFGSNDKMWVAAVVSFSVWPFALVREETRCDVMWSDSKGRCLLDCLTPKSTTHVGQELKRLRES